MVKLKAQKDRIISKVRKGFVTPRYQAAVVDAYQSYFISINQLLEESDPDQENKDTIDIPFMRNLTFEQADTIHQMHSLSRSAALGKVVDQNGNVATYP